jgi:hypothetical protein
LRYFQDKTDIRLIESSVTKLVNNSINEILRAGKSAVLECPVNYTNQTLVIAYQYVYTNKKTAIIFSDGKKISDLNDDYYMIKEDSVPQRLRVPIGIRNDDGIVIRVKFPKGAKKGLKKTYKQDYDKALRESDRSIIILASDTDHEKIKGEILQDDFKKPSLMIFNNTLPEEKISDMAEWCEENRIQYLILINHLSLSFYKNIGKGLIILPLSNGLLRDLSAVDESVSSAFRNPYYVKNSEIISKFSIDQPFHYMSGPTIDYVEIENGSVLNQCANEISGILKSMDIESAVLKYELIQLVRIAYDSIISFLPIDRLTRYSKKINARINGRKFCDIISGLSKESDAATYEKSQYLTATFMTMWNCLDECRTPFYDRGYTKDNKFSVLVDLIRDNLNNYEKIYVLPTNKNELSQVNKLLKSLFSEDLSKIAIMSMSRLDADDVENSMAILPGNPKPNELYVLNYPFREIKILTYHDNDFAFTRNFISVYRDNDIHNNVFSESIANIVEQVPKIQDYISDAPFIGKFASKLNNRNESVSEMDHTGDVNTVSPQPIPSHSVSETDVTEEINEVFASKYPDLKEFLDGLDSYKKIEKEYEKESVSEYTQNIKKLSEYYILTLENPYTGQLEVNYSSPKTKHIFFSDNKLKESIITKEMKGKMVVKVLGSQKDLLETLLDLYGLKDMVDYEIIDIWNECTSSFGNSSQGTSSIYRRYQEFGGDKIKQTVNKWFNGEIMGPRDKEDLEKIGMALDNDDLINNADYIFAELQRIRVFKRNLGRRLSKLVAAIIRQDQADLDDPISEMIRENVRDYLFVVKEIQKINGNDNS